MFSIEKAVHWRIITSAALWKEDSVCLEGFPIVCMRRTPSKDGLGSFGKLGWGTSDLGSGLGRWDTDSGSPGWKG